LAQIARLIIAIIFAPVAYVTKVAVTLCGNRYNVTLLRQKADVMVLNSDDNYSVIVLPSPQKYLDFH